MKKIEVEVRNEKGLHARPVSVLVTEASKYTSDISAIKDGVGHNCKSIVSILKMGASKGDILTIEISGEDEEKAATVLKEMFENSFGE